MNEELKKITGILLDKNAGIKEISEACDSLYNLFVSLSSFKVPAGNLSVLTKSGRALSPEVAALCIKDVIRTRQTIRGIYQAIKDKLDENIKPVKILYAGTGPFATLVTPLTTCFSPEEIRFQFLEIHPSSAELLHKIVTDLDISEYVHEILTTDATSFKITENFQPDIIVSETMNAGLMCEPQVAIMAHLFNQVPVTTIMIPGNISVDVCLAEGVQAGDDEIYYLGTLLKLNDVTARIISNDPHVIPVLNGGLKISIPGADPKYTSLILRTKITIYKDISIGFNESGLTIPLLQLVRDPKTLSFPSALNFNYVMGRQPGFIYTIIK
jgi:predicted RNA methylase